MKPTKLTFPSCSVVFISKRAWKSLIYHYKAIERPVEGCTHRLCYNNISGLNDADCRVVTIEELQRMFQYAYQNGTKRKFWLNRHGSHVYSVRLNGLHYNTKK
jgi:hypothetical protein